MVTCVVVGHRGKFGEVKRCVELSTGREFAAKFIATPRPQDRKDVDHEVAMMNQLHHRRLAQLYDAFQSDNDMCLLIEMYDHSLAAVVWRSGSDTVVRRISQVTLRRLLLLMHRPTGNYRHSRHTLSC